MLPVGDQICAFLLVMGLGMLMGFLFDCYRTIRQIWRPGYWGTILGDTLFWLVTTGVSYCFLLFSIWGEVRFYVFLALGAGVFIYLKFCSRRVLGLLYRVYLILAMTIRWVVKVLLIPLRICWRFFLLPFRFFSLFFWVMIRGLRFLKNLIVEVPRRVKRKLIPPGDPPENLS